MEFSRQEYQSGLPFPPPGDLPNPGNELMSLASTAWPGRFFTHCTTWEYRISKNGTSDIRDTGWRERCLSGDSLWLLSRHEYSPTLCMYNQSWQQQSKNAVTAWPKTRKLLFLSDPSVSFFNTVVSFHPWQAKSWLWQTVSISLGSVYITSFYFSHYSHHVFPKQKLLISWCPMLGSARLRILFLGFSPHTVWIFWMTVINNFRKVYSSLTGIKKYLCSLFIEKNSKSKMLFVNIV